MNADEVHIAAKTKLCLFQNGNYVKAFNTLNEIDEYLREICKWQFPADIGGFMCRRFKSERWTIVKSDFIMYEKN